MTILEALKSAIWIEGVPDDSYTKALIDAELTGSDTYTVDDKDKVNGAAIGILKSLPVKSISEGGYSITYDRDAIEKNIAALGGGPKVNGVTVW